MITAEEGAKRWVEESLRAYLDGKKDLKWIIGILNGLSENKIRGILDSFGQYDLPERRRELNGWLIGYNLVKSASKDECIKKLKEQKEKGKGFLNRNTFSEEFYKWDTETKDIIRNCFNKDRAEAFKQHQGAEYRRVMANKLIRIDELIADLKNLI